MASSMVIPCRGKTLAFESPLDRFYQIPKSTSFVSFPNSGVRHSSSNRISASMVVSDFPTYSPWLNDSGLSTGFNESVMIRDNEPVFSDNLEEWMGDSVVEIVKSLKKAPLLVHVYCKNGGSMEVKTEKGFAENWPNLKREWSLGERKSPDGIILVEEIEDDKAVELEIEEEEEEEEETKAWGVLIQGKRECRTACYLLKTCRVNSGLGFFGTHFSLVKVNNFRETAFSQIKNSWLLQ